MVFRKKKKVPAQTLAALKAANEKRAAAAAAAAAKESSAAAVDANDAGVVLMEWEVAKKSILHSQYARSCSTGQSTSASPQPLAWLSVSNDNVGADIALFIECD